MTDWQITATTIFCEAVDDEVTVMVHRDGTVKCTGCRKYAAPSAETARLLREKGRKLHRELACAGTGCALVTAYREKLLAEETEI